MARYTGPVCKLCRREGLKLFLKGSRCETPKCSIERREYPPGMHQWKRGKASEYSLRLREKQKVKRYYGVLERQFRKYFEMAGKMKGNTGENLMTILERRLDNIVTRLGFAKSRPQARQLINHGHVLVNGRKLDVVSYLLRPNDTIRIKGRERSLKQVRTVMEEGGTPPVPDFLEMISTDPPEARLTRLPSLQDIGMPVQPQLIVELLSR